MGNFTRLLFFCLISCKTTQKKIIKLDETKVLENKPVSDINLNYNFDNTTLEELGLPCLSKEKTKRRLSSFKNAKLKILQNILKNETLVQNFKKNRIPLDKIESFYEIVSCEWLENDICKLKILLNSDRLKYN